jgi:ATP-dependent Clp protease adapter protein ClpS
VTGVDLDSHHPAIAPLTQARSIGQAIITCAPKEHAEFYAQQLWQRGCKVSMEPDTTTV